MNPKCAWCNRAMAANYDEVCDSCGHFVHDHLSIDGQVTQCERCACPIKVRHVKPRKILRDYGYDGYFCRKDCGYRYGLMVTTNGMPPPTN